MWGGVCLRCCGGAVKGNVLELFARGAAEVPLAALCVVVFCPRCHGCAVDGNVVELFARGAVEKPLTALCVVVFARGAAEVPLKAVWCSCLREVPRRCR